jgi:AcrR family transcriptional regulator
MPSTYPTAAERPLRRDARQNRDRILVAARAAFAERGVDASVEEIAVRAGVGIGTLYRRFPTKDELIGAVFGEHLEQIASAAEAALERDDPWPAFLGYLSYVVELQAIDRGISEILGAHPRPGVR